MKRNIKFFPYYIFFLLCSGCSLFESVPDRTRLFDIGFKPRASPGKASSSSTDNPSICLILKHFPDYLDAPQITTKVGEHELKSNPLYRWATPLSENIFHILRQSIQQSFPKAQIYEFPKDIVPEVDLTLKLDINLLEIDETSQRVFFSGTWTILDRKQKRSNRFPFEFCESLGKASDHYAEIVAKIEQVVLQLGDGIVNQINLILTETTN
ncbi:MAG: PqiC family protein [Puniceicoccales bacterium]|jgi:uncharacterized lipoprotein YmbA|nr:PqiC family protein [Puniceicoccales bacterium]